MGNLAQHRLSDLLTGTEENCASQAFSQLCHPCNRIISPCDSKRGAYSPYRASAPQSMRLTSTGPRALAAGWVTPLCVLGLGVHGDTKPQLCSHRPGAIRCRIRAGRSPGCAAMNWGGRTDTRGVGSPRGAQLLGGWVGGVGATQTPPPARTAAARCCFAFATRAEVSTSFRSPVEIPQQHQQRGLQRPANLPRTSRQELGRCHLHASHRSEAPGLRGRIIRS